MKLLLELAVKHSFDCIGLQETIKSSFRQRVLKRFAGQKDMFWSWLPCKGHFGGLLMGVDKELASVSSEDMGTFYQSINLTMKADGFQWTLLNIYGPAYDDRKLEFLEEIQAKVQSAEHPVLLGGDFNLIRRVEEKSNGNVNVHMMEAFNEMIDNTALRDLHRTGSRFTWTNKQNPPIMCVLDRVLVSNSWEEKFNVVSVVLAPRLGSDHNPLIVDIGQNGLDGQHYFRFSVHLLQQEGFKAWVNDKWLVRFKHDPLGHRHVVSSKLRRAVNGRGQNLDSHRKLFKKETLGRIATLDDWGDNKDLTSAEWEERYDLERILNQMLAEEEMQWQRRGGEQWLLADDSNTSYFHKCANGRRGKMHISALEVDGEEVVDPQSLRAHIIDYYKSLFGSEEVADMHLDVNMWLPSQQIQPEDNEFLTRPFTLDDLDQVIKEMKNNQPQGQMGTL